jgi:hypothetical protein
MTDTVTVELIQNGRPVATQRIVADGTLHDVTFEARIAEERRVVSQVPGKIVSESEVD